MRTFYVLTNSILQSLSYQKDEWEWPGKTLRNVKISFLPYSPHPSVYTLSPLEKPVSSSFSWLRNYMVFKEPGSPLPPLQEPLLPVRHQMSCLRLPILLPILILYSYISTSSNWSPSPIFHSQNGVWIVIFLHSCYVSTPFQYSIDYSNIRRRVKSMELPNHAVLSVFLSTFSVLGLNIILSSPYVRDQLSHAYKIYSFVYLNILVAA